MLGSWSQSPKSGQGQIPLAALSCLNRRALRHQNPAISFDVKMGAVDMTFPRLRSEGRFTPLFWKGVAQRFRPGPSKRSRSK